MDVFQNAKTVRLRSHHERYLVADEDHESVTQERKGSTQNARWTVEAVESQDSMIRLKGCYEKYLTASNQPFLLGMSGRKVLQTLPKRLDSSLEWLPIKEGSKVRLQTPYGHFLKANSWLPPWRNSITHDVPHRSSSQDWILWDVEVLEQSDHQKQSKQEVMSHGLDEHEHEDEQEQEQEQGQGQEHEHDLDLDHSHGNRHGHRHRHRHGHHHGHSRDHDQSHTRHHRHHHHHGHSVDDHAKEQPPGPGPGPDQASECDELHLPLPDGRVIYYHIADEHGDVDESVEAKSFLFKGHNVAQLSEKLEQDTELHDVFICTRSPLNGKLFPLRLQLPPNNQEMHIVIVPSTSQLGLELAKGF